MVPMMVTPTQIASLFQAWRCGPGSDYVQGFVVARPQDPAQLLTASSSASFVRDPELLRLVDSFGQSDGTVLMVDFFEPPVPTKAH